MGSITLSEVLRQTRELVSDPEDALYGDLDSAMADAIKCLLERIAVSEVEKRAGARLYERGDSRMDYRNGYRRREVQTAYKTITIRIPRLRGQGYVPTYLEPGHRAIAEVDQRWWSDRCPAARRGPRFSARQTHGSLQRAWLTPATAATSGWRGGSHGAGSPAGYG